MQLAKQLIKLNFTLCGTRGTADYINQHGIKCKKVNKVNQGSPHIVDVLNAKKIALVINTGGGNSETQLSDAVALRRATLANKVPYCTNMSTAKVCLEGIKSLKIERYKCHIFTRYLIINFPISLKSHIINLNTSSLFFNLLFSPCHAKCLVRL